MKNPQPDNTLATAKNHLAQPIELPRLRSLLTTDVMARRELPNDLNKIAELCSAIDAKLFYDFASTRLSDGEQESLTNGHEDFRSVHSKWDCYILGVAQQYGAWLLLSTLGPHWIEESARTD